MAHSASSDQSADVVSRRRFLTGSLVGAGTLAAGCAPNAGGLAAPDASEAQTYPFFGARQLGVVAPPTPSALAVGLDVRVSNRSELLDLFTTLSDAIEHVMSARPYERRPGGYPPFDTGVLGSNPPPTNTTVVVGVGNSLFDERFGLADLCPTELQPMPRFRNDSMVDESLSHGDLSIVVSADHAEATTHALRQILRVTRGRLIPRWTQTGFQRIDHDRSAGEAPGRNLLGFKDGTVNPDPTDEALMDDTVWVAASDREPAWFVGGTYQAIRIIRMQVEFWDRTRLNEQERIFHRHRDSGAPLGADRETAEPSFDGDLSSHIARANPRDGSTPHFSMLRKGFNYANGLDGNDQLDHGLVFVSYQRSLATGFLGVQRRLDGEALEEYIRPVGGGLFAVPPAPPAGDVILRELLES